jgi:hypothetical protein
VLDGTSTTRPISAPKCPPHHVPARSNASEARRTFNSPSSPSSPIQSNSIQSNTYFTLSQALPSPKPALTMPAAPKRTGFKKASSFAPKRAASTTSSAPAAKRAKAESDNEDDGSTEGPVYVPVSDQARV